MVAAEKSPQSGRQRQMIPMGTRSTRIDRTYGRMVQFLKVALPTLALMLIALLIAWPRLSEQTTLPGMKLFDIDGNSAIRCSFPMRAIKVSTTKTSPIP